MTGLILTPATIIVPELLKIARAVHRSRDYCIVRNYVIAAMHNDGLTEAEIAGTLAKHRTTIYHALRVHSADSAQNEAYNAIIQGLSAL